MIIIPIKPHLVDVDYKRNLDFWENCTYVDKMVGNELPGPTFLQICLWDMKPLYKLCVWSSQLKSLTAHPVAIHFMW